MFPAAIFFAFLYAQLSNRFSREKVFYVMVSIFIVYFLLFVGLIFPNKESLELSGTAIYLEGFLPEGFKGFTNMIRYWYFSMFYVSVELWSSVILSILFWGFANEVTTLNESKKFYAILALGANLTAILGGRLGTYLWKTREFNPNLNLGADKFEQALDINILLSIVLAFALIAVFRWMNTSCKHMYKDDAPPACEQTESSEPHKNKKKKKMSLVESLRYVLKNKYLIHLAIMVFSYNVVYNLTDVVWMDTMYRHFGSKSSEYTAFNNSINEYIGWLAILMALATGPIIRILGWRFAALLTPIGLMVTSLSFFPLLIFYGSDFVDHIGLVLAPIFGNDLIRTIMIIATAQKCFTRASKFSVFDATKEMAYIPINTYGKRKAKAAIDGIGSRLGKSSGSFMIQMLLIPLSTMSAIVPYVSIVIVLITALWLYSVIQVNKDFKKKISTPTK